MIILQKFDSKHDFWEFAALRYAEKWGIVNYIQKNGIIFWEEKYPYEGTFAHTLDIDTMKHRSTKIA